MKLRGPGEFFGIRQHGFPEFKLADVTTDLDSLNCARRTAFEMVKDDPSLNKNPRIKTELVRRFGDIFKHYAV